jgi:hypothetical protein
MSNGYDFFGTGGGPGTPPATGQSAADSAERSGAHGAVDRFGMPISAATQAPPAPPHAGYAPSQPGYPPQPGYAPPPYAPAGFSAPAWQQPPAKQSRNTPRVIGGVVLAAAVAAGTFFFLNRSHPISLPSTVGGMAEVTSLTSSEKSDLKDTEKDLGKRAHIQDITGRLYGDVNSGAFFILAGHIHGSDTSMSDVANQVAAAAAGAGANYSTGTLSSGGTDYECVWASSAGHDVSVCFWWSNHSVLMGEGLGIDAQSTADALAEAKTYAGLK